MKILEQNGHKYSRESFDGYEFRVKFEFDVRDQKYTSNVDIYTTDSDKGRVHKVVADKTSEKVFGINIVHWTTKEQDTRDSLFIEETLKDL